MNKETSIKYNGDTYIVKSQYDYDLYELRLNKDKEIERLSKGITKYDEILCERNNEIDRLNKECDTYMKIATKRGNIIDELEKDIKKKIKDIKNNYSQINGNYFNMNYVIETYENVLDKLKALKEGK